MAWTYLLLAGLFEIGWPVGLKMGWAHDGIGAVGTFALGIVACGDPAAPLRVVSAGLIVAGVEGLKLFS